MKRRLLQSVRKPFVRKVNGLPNSYSVRCCLNGKNQKVGLYLTDIDHRWWDGFSVVDYFGGAYLGA